jgi:hypothetical protein
MARTKPFGGGPKGKEGFPMGDKKHQRLAIGGATRSYRAGNISKSKEEAIKGAARRKLGMDKPGAAKAHGHDKVKSWVNG